MDSNNSIFKVLRDITTRIAKLEKLIGCVPRYTPDVGNATPTTDYTHNLIETVDGTEDTFTLRHNFIIGTTNVVLRGMERQRGATKEYEEEAPNKIKFTTPPLADSEIIVHYYIKS